MFGLSAVGLVCVEKRAVLVKQILYYQICVFVVDVCGRERVGWGGAHGCFLWENSRSEVRGQCLRGGHSGDEVRSDSGQILLDKFLYILHLLQKSKRRR